MGITARHKAANVAPLSGRSLQWLYQNAWNVDVRIVTRPSARIVVALSPRLWFRKPNEFTGFRVVMEFNEVVDKTAPTLASQPPVATPDDNASTPPDSTDSAADDNLDAELLRAAAAGNLDTMKLLKSQGAGIELRDSRGQTPMRLCVMQGHLEAMKWLKENGADVSEADNEGFTLMHFAARNGHIEAMMWLKEQGVGVNIRDKEGQTPIFSAALGGHAEAIQWLKEQSAEVDIKDIHGQTPLEVAFNEGHKEAVRCLDRCSG
jgi:ankyrin repeat protein